MEISILISTIDEGIEKVKNVILSPRADVEYIVSHQYTSESYKYVPTDLKRSDIKLSHIKGQGVTKSRNNALRLATGDVGLFADDDVTYLPEYFETLKQAFQDLPDADVILFKIKTGSGESEYKNYPSQKVRLKKLAFPVSTVEIAFNVDRLKKLGVSFDERFGAGNKLLIYREETIFIEDCLKHGGKIFFNPRFIVEHPYESTLNSVQKYDKRRNWVDGAYDARTFGKKALIRSLKDTIRKTPDLLRHGINPMVYFYHRISAVIYILSTSKEQKN